MNEATQNDIPKFCRLASAAIVTIAAKIPISPMGDGEG